MGIFLFLAFIVLPIAELAVIVTFAQNIGLLWTLVMLFGFSIAGSILAKQQGLDVWRRMRATLASGEMPSSEVVDGFLILLAGALLLTPGFLTDAVGVVLLIPPARAAIRRMARRVFRRYVDHRVFGPRSGPPFGPPSGPRPGRRGAQRARVVRVASREKPPETGI